MKARRNHLVAVAAVAAALMLGACGGDGTDDPASGKPGDPTTPGDAGTFARIQSSVLTPTCAVSGCHVAASAAVSGNLVLTADVAYDNLVGVVPANLTAKQNGLRRITAGKPDSSLLFQKIALALVGHDGNDYGNVMPVGTTPLNQGQVDYIRKWIEAGAPRSGSVADVSLLSNTAAQAAAKFTPLVAPPAGQGYQIHVDSFGVAPNFERELFVYRPLGNMAPTYVNRIQTAMRQMSHHFVLYSADPANSIYGPLVCPPQANVVRDIRRADGSMDLLAMAPMTCHVFIAGSMTSTSDYAFPAGVALEMPANMAIDMNVHYANRTSVTIPGEAYANLYTVPAGTVQKVAHTLNWANNSITLPPRKVTTLEKTFTVSQPTTVFMLTSHMHMLGTKFEIRIVGGARDGETVYTSTDWEHPQMVAFKEPIVLQKGQGLKSVITWNNYTDKTVTFGLQSTDEMGIIFGYYY